MVLLLVVVPVGWQVRWIWDLVRRHRRNRLPVAVVVAVRTMDRPVWAGTTVVALADLVAMVASVMAAMVAATVPAEEAEVTALRR